MEEEKRVFPYSDPVQKNYIYTDFVTREYLVPFNYKNVNVVRVYNCGEKHGMELNPLNAYWPDPSQPPADYIEVIEDDPIIKVEVIGSACTPPGYIQLMFDPCDDFYRPDEPRSVTATRMRINNLWGMHLRADQWLSETPGVKSRVRPEPYDPPPEKTLRNGKHVKADWHEFPLVGFSTGVFSIPRSKSIRITGGSEIPGWVGDNYACDGHYSFRIIRTTVCKVEVETR